MQIKKADVLVIGAGGAGVTAAVEAAAAGASVIIVTKEPVGYGDTRLALGIMCTGVDTNTGDSVEQFVNDMIVGGGYLNDSKLVQALVDGALDATLTVEGFGHIFNRDDTGALRKLAVPPGGHRSSRHLTSPSVGISMCQAIRAAAARSRVEVLEETICAELLVKDGEVVGAAAYEMTSGEALALLAKSTVIAAGGAGALYYPHTDCMPSVTGDSFGLALNAGAELVDMEQIQLLCFGATHPPSMIGIPLGEPVMAGPFGKLYNNKGELICEDMMTKTRAQVSNAMMEEIHQGGATEHGGLLLDLKPNVDSEIGEFYVSTIRNIAGPFIEQIRRAYGEKASNFEEPWDVLPTVHYFMGGVKTDEWCRSCIPALYACGQAQGGVMGGNRLGATSLTEIFVFGKRAGKTAAKEAGQRQLTDEAVIREPIDKLASLPGSKGTYRPIHIKRSLQKLMWTYVGARRDVNGLVKAIEEIGTVKKQAKDLSISDMEHYNTEVADAIELSHMLASAEAIALSALERKESRGAHVRSDFPEPEKGLVKNIAVKMKGSGYEIRLTEAC